MLFDSKDCSVFISGEVAPHQHIEVKADSEETIKGLSKGIYIMRLQNAEITDTRRVTIQ